MTTISSCHIRRTTFPIKYAHAAGTPPLACSAPSECVLSISSTTSAGTVAEHVYVTLYRCRDASRSRRAYRARRTRGLPESTARSSRARSHGLTGIRTRTNSHELDGGPKKPKHARPEFVKKLNKIKQIRRKSRKSKESPCGPWPSLPSAVYQVSGQQTPDGRRLASGRYRVGPAQGCACCACGLGWGAQTAESRC